jgi:hypothetical protein
VKQANLNLDAGAQFDGPNTLATLWGQLGETGPPWVGHAWPETSYDLTDILLRYTDDEIKAKQEALAKIAPRFVIQLEYSGEEDAVQRMLRQALHDATSSPEEREAARRYRVQPEPDTAWHPDELLKGLIPFDIT